jgi:hypothetical protein
MSMSTPLIDRGAFIGVLTLYTDSNLPITAGSERMMEALAPHVASIIGRASAAPAAAGTTTCDQPDSQSGQPLRAWRQPPATPQ